MRVDTLFLPSFAALVFACGGQWTNDDAPAEALAPEEIKEWTYLFDGTDLAGFHRYGGGEVGKAWSIDNGTLYFDPEMVDETGTTLGGDIVTNQAFANYELELDWKISPCGNSGIIYNVVESDDLDYPWLTGPEMQVLDNSCHPDAKIYKHRAGDLYDLIAADSTAVKPAGAWNAVRLVVTPGQVEHWLNGQKVLEYTNTDDAWRAMIEKSKFREFTSFGSATSGKIALQDHGDKVWYRNIRVREL